MLGSNSKINHAINNTYQVELVGNRPDLFPILILKNDFLGPSLASVDTILTVNGGCKYSKPPNGGFGQPVANFKNALFSVDDNSPTICHNKRMTG